MLHASALGWIILPPASRTGGERRQKLISVVALLPSAIAEIWIDDIPPGRAQPVRHLPQILEPQQWTEAPGRSRKDNGQSIKQPHHNTGERAGRFEWVFESDLGIAECADPSPIM